MSTSDDIYPDVWLLIKDHLNLRRKHNFYHTSFGNSSDGHWLGLIRFSLLLIKIYIEAGKQCAQYFWYIILPSPLWRCHLVRRRLLGGHPGYWLPSWGGRPARRHSDSAVQMFLSSAHPWVSVTLWQTDLQSELPHMEQATSRYSRKAARQGTSTTTSSLQVSQSTWIWLCFFFNWN